MELKALSNFEIVKELSLNNKFNFYPSPLMLMGEFESSFGSFLFKVN